MLSKSEVLSLVVCPACKQALSNLNGCGACGTGFTGSNGIASLIPATAQREVTYNFQSSRSVLGDGFKEALRYPPATGADKSVYHLDLAHSAILNDLPPNARVLEIGCGGGQMRLHLQERGVRYVGVDISAGERVLEDLRAHGGPDLLCDAHFLPFPDNSFDVVYASAVFEHLASPFLGAQEVARVLKRRGRFIGSVSFLEPWHDDSFFHLSPLGVYEMLIQADLKPDYIWPGKGWNGFKAIAQMSSRATQKLTLVAELLNAAYVSSTKLRNKLRPRSGASPIEDEARITGAMVWISTKLSSEPAQFRRP
jgi:SAM-dependent methyltransferase